MVTYCSSTYYSDHFETYRNIKSLCGVTGANSVVDQLLFQNQQTHRKRDQIYGPQRQGLGQGVGVELDADSQKVQSSNYKMNKY